MIIESGYKLNIGNEFDTFEHSSNIRLHFESSDDWEQFTPSNESKCYVLGCVDFIHDNSIGLNSLNEAIRALVDKNITSCQFQDIVFGRYFIISFTADQIFIFADKFSCLELYYLNSEEKFLISTSLEVYADHISPKYNQACLANLLSVYGNYAPKGFTIYNEIFGLKVRQTLHYRNGVLSVDELDFKPENSENYDSDKLGEYAEIFLDSVSKRSSNDNWVYMSSGWDSSSVLAALHELKGSSSINAIIARFKYSEKSGINNQFEVDRAKQITDYFNVKLHIVDVDYTLPEYLDYWQKFIPIFKNNHLYAMFAYNFFRLADYISTRSSSDTVVFNGETSDGSHNLGFSQFASILEHQDLDFREYSDKMNSYLYSPSFLRLISNRQELNDPIYNIFKQRRLPDHDYDISGEINWKNDYLSSLFFSSERIPFAPILNSPIVKQKAKDDFKKLLGNHYFSSTAERLSPENLYSWVLDLYNSFHWHGGSVRGMLYSSEKNSLKTASPFWDSRMQVFLSKMPENWGRGLDFNRTKYPLKWTLENKLDYPSHLQVGPHSYLYDINPNWSADHDILFGCSQNHDYFCKRINESNLCEILSGDYFDIDYLQKCITKYKNKDNDTPISLLKNVVSMGIVGWY